MAKDKMQLYLMVAILLIAAVVIIYLLYQKSQSSGNGNNQPPIDPDPDIPPGQQILSFDRTTSYQKSITWELGGNYQAILLAGNFRVGGWVYTNIKIKVRDSNGSWHHLTTVGGPLSGSQPFTEFNVTCNYRINKVKWEAEQGVLPWVGDRYIDEVHAQLFVEV